jgi:hypothetical protein
LTGLWSGIFSPEKEKNIGLWALVQKQAAVHAVRTTTPQSHTQNFSVVVCFHRAACEAKKYYWAFALKILLEKTPISIFKRYLPNSHPIAQTIAPIEVEILFSCLMLPHSSARQEKRL